VIQKIPRRVRRAWCILVDHDMSLVSACCGTTAVIDFGKADRVRARLRWCCATST
jgi:ABC-type branched-subunit amino acid transport system ATPase component